MTILQETENGNSRQNDIVEPQQGRNSCCNDNVELKENPKYVPGKWQQEFENMHIDSNDGTSSFVRPGIKKEIAKQVLRQKLSKLRHLVLSEAISPAYLDSMFPDLLKLFDPQKVTYNGGIANIKEWKISCYLEVMDGGVPTANPNTDLLHLFTPLLDECNNLFLYWYRQKSACNISKLSSTAKKGNIKCSRLMTFITRYTPAPGEQALLKVRSSRLVFRISFCKKDTGVQQAPSFILRCKQLTVRNFFIFVARRWIRKSGRFGCNCASNRSMVCTGKH